MGPARVVIGVALETTGVVEGIDWNTQESDIHDSVAYMYCKHCLQSNRCWSSRICELLWFLLDPQYAYCLNNCTARTQWGVELQIWQYDLLLQLHVPSIPSHFISMRVCIRTDKPAICFVVFVYNAIRVEHLQLQTILLPHCFCIWVWSCRYVF